jgi:hypothetical protein
MNNLILSITKFLMTWCEKRGRVLKITGTGSSADVYLIRYYIVRSKFFNFFIHQFLRSDRDDLHDHPWNFCTYLVKGAYTEKKFNLKTQKAEITQRANYPEPMSYMDLGIKKYIPPMKLNTFVFRKATDQHQVLVQNTLQESDKNKAPLTLCFTGPVKREWGFIKTDSNGNRTWENWRSYLGLSDDTPGRG